MTIAVNTRFLLKDNLEGVGYFIYETLSRIVQKYPQHRFVFIFDRPYNKQFVFASNVIPVVAGPAARHPILWKFWYDVKIPAVLRKHKADIFVSPDSFCSLATKTPQCLVLHDLAFLHHPSFIPASHLLFYKRYTGKFLAKAKTVATVSEFSKADILKHYTIAPDKLHVVYSAARNIFQPLNNNEKEEVKNKYTGGKEYFLCTGAIHPRKNPENLLKAFSVFKNRQQSGMKLVLAGRLAWKFKSFTEKLKTYKYRDDVVLTGYIQESEMAKLTGAAYAVVYPSLHEGFGVPVLEAMQCNVPVITSSGSSMQEIAKEAVLYADASDYHSIADKMMLLYKDETLRSTIIEKGIEAVKLYSWDKTAGLLWEAIIKAAQTI